MEMEKKVEMEMKKETITREVKMETAKIGCRQMKNPNALSIREIGELTAKCEYAQTPGMIKYFKSLNPSLWDISDLIAKCKYAQTPEMLKYFKSLKPSTLDVRWLIKNCDYCNTKNMRRYYKALNIILENE